MFQLFLGISRDSSEYRKFLGIYREVGTLFLPKSKKQSFNVGDKSDYVPYQSCKKLFYPFEEKATRNVKHFRYC